jgi:hypothetical protein
MLTVAVERVKINFDRFSPPALKICSYPAAGQCARSTVLHFYVLSSWICKSLTTSVNEHVADNTRPLYVKFSYQINQEQDFDSSKDVYASVLWVMLNEVGITKLEVCTRVYVRMNVCVYYVCI